MKRLVGLIFILLLASIGFAQVDAYLKNIGATRSSNFTIRDSSMLIELNLTSKNSMFRNAEKAQGYAHLTYKISRKMIRINQKTGWILHFVFGKGKKSTAFLRRQQSTLDRLKTRKLYC